VAHGRPGLSEEARKERRWLHVLVDVLFHKVCLRLIVCERKPAGTRDNEAVHLRHLRHQRTITLCCGYRTASDSTERQLKDNSHQMSQSADVLSNAERLISDAAHLHAEGRSRSAATLIVVALEQLGAFVEILTREKYPNAVLHIGIFGEKANAHAKRQDALAAHVLNFALGAQTVMCLAEKYYEETEGADPEGILEWAKTALSIEFSPAQKKRMKECPDVVVAYKLMDAVKTSHLKSLREYGLYEDTGVMFSDASVGEMIVLTAKVREILSRAPILSETMKIAGINMPEGLVIKEI
jgi:hypothetical protein